MKKQEVKYEFYETDRLILRLTDLDDADFVFELMNSPKWLEFIGDREIATLEDAKDYITVKMIDQVQKLGFGNYTVIRKEDNAKLGTCGLYDREGMKGLDIGFALLPSYEGKGYALEASMLLRDLAFDEFKQDLLNGITTDENTSSQRLLEKLGMTPVGKLQLENDPKNFIHYRMKKEERNSQ